MAHLVVGSPGPLMHHLVRRLLAAGEEVILIGGPGTADQPGVRVLAGEITKIDFGLAGSTYGELCRTVRRLTVVELTEHLPVAQLRYSDGERARPIRVAAEVSEFICQASDLRGVVYLSSLAVFGDHQGLIAEKDFAVPRTFSERRDEVLAIAEKQIHRVAGMAPLAVLRIASLAGSESNGEILIGSELARLAQFAALAPEECEFRFEDKPVHFETVERTVDALLQVRPDKELVALHLVDDDPWSDRELVSWMFERVQKRVVEVQRSGRAVAQWLRAAAMPPGRVRTSSAEFGRAEAVRQLGGLMKRDIGATLHRLFMRSTMTGVVE